MSPHELIFQVEEAPDGGFTAQALGESIYTQAETYDALKDAVREAVACYFDEGQGPKMIRLHLVRDELLAV
jgi:hypothetical protein